MNQPHPRKNTVTAAELMERLEQDPQYIARREEADVQWREGVKQHKLAMQPVLQELAGAGFSVESLDDLRRSRVNYKGAVPVLLKWLSQVTDEWNVKESIVRTLSVPWAKPAAALPLIAEFRKVTDPASGLKWAIGNALEVVANDSVFEEIAELVCDKRNGKSREMLAVALGNMKNPAVVDLLIELLKDEEVAGHVIIGLGKLRANKARSKIEPFLTHPKPWIRKEAKKALGRLSG